jgi:MFS family permease
LTLGQVIAGIGAALLIPNNLAIVLQAYSGRQREVAIIAQTGLTAIGVSLGLMFGATLVSLRGWRAPFIALLVLQILTLLMAFRLRLPRSLAPGAKVDLLSVALSAAGIVLVIGAVNQVGPWGALAAIPAAPISLFGISPALLMFLGGALLLRSFVLRQRRLRLEHFATLLAPEVMDSKVTRASMIVSVAATLLFAGAAYVLLLYAEVVLHYSAVWSALFILPLSVAAVAAAVAAPALMQRWQPRLVVAVAFLLAAAATLLLAAKVSNTWSNPALWFDEILIGLGVGVALAVSSQVLIDSVPDSWSSDVGSTQCVPFIGTALGTSVAGAVLMSVLASSTATLVDQHASLMLPPSVELSATSVRFVSNDELRWLLSQPPWHLTPEQLDEAVEINIDARLAALRASLHNPGPAGACRHGSSRVPARTKTTGRQERRVGISGS